MKFRLLLSLCIFISLQQGFSQTPADTFHISSAYVKNGKYIAEVTLPPNYSPEKTYPVFYFLDLKLAEPLMKNVSDSLLRIHAAADYIFVGIKCDDTARWCYLQRMRDFSPTYVASEDVRVGNPDLSQHLTGGAPQFTLFLKEELFPLIEKKYKTQSEQRTLFGMSFSGLYVVYVLLESPELFSQYVIGAPSLWYNNFEMIGKAQAVDPEKWKAVRKVYMGIGDKDHAMMLKGFNTFTEILKEKGVRLKSEIYEGKDHTGIWRTILEKGIPHVFPGKKK